MSLFDFDDIRTEEPDPSSPEEGVPASLPDPDLPLCNVEDCFNSVDMSSYGGRGRKPVKCAEHRTRTSARSGTASSGTSRKVANRLATLEEDITVEFTKLGTVTSSMLPVFGITMVSRAQRTAKALVKFAEQDKSGKLLAALETSAKVVPALDLGETVLALGVALMVDTGRLDPDGVVSTMTGARDIWYEVNDEEKINSVGHAEANATAFDVAVPPRFQAVG